MKGSEIAKVYYNLDKPGKYLTTRKTPHITKGHMA